MNPLAPTSGRTHLAPFAPMIAAEIRAGRSGSRCTVRGFDGKGMQQSIAHLASCELCDTPGNLLHLILQHLGRRAAGGDLEAASLVDGIAEAIERTYGTPDDEELEHHSATSHAEARIRRTPV